MEFVTPLFLVCILAAAIPLVLHLISNIRVQQTRFPTLRFLRMSMDRTARRRRVQNVLLLLLRMALLALLAVAMAEPLSRAVGTWTGRNEYAAVVILDNSMSMGARKRQGTRFTDAKAQAQAMLSGGSRPAAAAVIPTNGPVSSRELVTSLDSLRKGIERTGIYASRAPVAKKVAEALRMLAGQSRPLKTVYIFSDLQKVSFDSLAALPELSAHQDVHMLVVDTSGPQVSNVAVADLEIKGLRVVDSVLEFAATVVNSGSADRVVNVGLRLEAQKGAWLGPGRQVQLRAAGREGSAAKVRFYHRFPKPGVVVGQVALDMLQAPAGDAGDLSQRDDLPLDNVRRFSLVISDRVKALVAPGSIDRSEMMGAASMLGLALAPYAAAGRPWPIASKTVPAANVTRADLRQVQAVFFSNVPGFSRPQARAIEEFTRNGGTVVFFLGPDVKEYDNYNQRFLREVKAEGGLLPAELAGPVGQVGPNAPGLRADFVDIEHPYFSGLLEDREDYLRVIVQRYFRLKPLPRPGRTLMRLENGDPLMMTKDFGKGRVVLCATTASPKWTNLPITGLFLPAVARMALLAPRALGRSESYIVGSPVLIRPAPAGGAKLPPGAVVRVTLPEDPSEAKPRIIRADIQQTAEGYLARFTDTNRPGTYRWRVVAPATARGQKLPAGAFVVNPQGVESYLAALSPDQFKRAMRKRGMSRVYVGRSLEEANKAAAADTKGHNWWDLFLVLVIFILVVEAVVANRRAGREPDTTAALSPAQSG